MNHNETFLKCMNMKAFRSEDEYAVFVKHEIEQPRDLVIFFGFLEFEDNNNFYSNELKFKPRKVENLIMPKPLIFGICKKKGRNDYTDLESPFVEYKNCVFTEAIENPYDVEDDIVKFDNCTYG